MKIDTSIKNRNDEELKISDTEIRAASTIFGDNTLQNAIWLKQGNFSLCMTLEREDAENLISALNNHISNIKANELELIALQTKAAA